MAEQNDRFAEPITVELRGLGKKTFRTITQLRNWGEKERTFWAELKNRLSDNFMGGHVPVDDFINQLQTLRQSIKGLVSAPDEHHRHQHMQKIKQVMGHYNKGHMLVSESEECKQIDDLSQEDPNTAAVALLRARDGYNNVTRNSDQQIKFSQIPNVQTFMQAWFALENDTVDRQKSLDRQKQSLNSLRSRWDTHLDNAEEQEREIEAKFKARQRRLASSAFGRLRRYRDLHNDHDQKMKTMREAFSTKMRLGAAQTFWRRKRSINRMRAKSALCTLFKVGAAGFALLFVIYWGISKAIGFPSEFNVTHSLIYAVPTVLFIWLLRIFANQYKANTALADDAEEREAMVWTFRALEYDDQKVGDEERIVILNALFRAHGTPPEETMPASLWDTVLQRSKSE